MTNEDAIELVKIIQWADGGCSSCVTGLMKIINLQWPNVDWRALYEEHATEGGGWYPDQS